jgi:hypothetical protein
LLLQRIVIGARLHIFEHDQRLPDFHYVAIMHSEFSDNTILEVLNDLLALNWSKNAGGQSSAGEWSQNAPNHKRSHECDDDGESNSIGTPNIPFQGMLTMPPGVRGQNFYRSAR